jgi:hypothetical protein
MARRAPGAGRSAGDPVSDPVAVARIGNPYLEEFFRAGGLLPEHERLRRPGLYIDLIARRWPLIRRYAHGVSSEEALAAIGALSPIVEVGAGAGYWARMLAERGADVVAYDRDPAGKWRGTDPTWFDVREADGAEAAARHPDRALLIIWPPFDTPMAEEALRAYGTAGGRRLAYVGEDSEGCTADAGFFRLLREAWRETAGVALPQWPGLHDGLWLYEKGPPEG